MGGKRMSEIRPGTAHVYESLSICAYLVIDRDQPAGMDMSPEAKKVSQPSDAPLFILCGRRFKVNRSRYRLPIPPC